jgi:hypothetical protein
VINTSVTNINFCDCEISDLDNINTLLTRNERFRRMFVLDARKMLLSVLCSDECGVVWPYLHDLLDGRDARTVRYLASREVETVRAEFAAFVEERRRRCSTAVVVEPLVAADDDDGRAVKRRRLK